MDKIQQIQSAVKDMYSRVNFTQDGHTYQVKETGEWLQGVSEVSSIVPKDWLSAWGAKEAVKALGYSDYDGDTERAEEVFNQIIQLQEDFLNNIQGDDHDGVPLDEAQEGRRLEKLKKYQAILKEAKGASRQKSKEALLDGKKGHELLENYIKWKMGKRAEPQAEGNLVRPFTQFKEWAEREVDTWILSEARVAFVDRHYGGTLDAMAIMKNGRLAVLDFKFASHISEDYFLQTAGYAATFEPYGIKVDDRIIVRLPKTLEREEWDAKERKYKKVENNLEVKVVDTDYEEDREAFFHALPLKKWINKVNQRGE